MYLAKQMIRRDEKSDEQDHPNGSIIGNFFSGTT